MMVKRIIQVQGHVLLPLVVDRPAVINQRYGGYTYTSPVVKISQITEQYVLFETQNTCYSVTTAPTPEEAQCGLPEAICA